MPTLRDLRCHVSVAMLASLARPAAAQSVEEFYRGKTVIVAIGFSVGGGYDLYARLLARHIGKYIPGRPERRRRRTAKAPAASASRFISTTRRRATAPWSAPSRAAWRWRR